MKSVKTPERSLAIDLNKSQLIINVVNYPEISKGLYVSMFNNAGFKLSKKGSIYIGDINRIKKIRLIKLRDRLSEKGYKIIENHGLFDIAENINKEISEDKARIKIGEKLKKNPTTTQINIPKFERELKGFQEDVVKHNIAVKNGANFSCPGSGKTTMIYAVYAYWKYNKNYVNKILVISPISAFAAWETEYTECFGKKPRSIRLHGPNRYVSYKESKEYELFLI